MRAKRAAVAIGSVLVSLLVSAPPAAAVETTQQVSMTFSEPIMSTDCDVIDGFCGKGWVIPLGRATETIEFGAGCDGACDLRTITVPGGSIFLEETFRDPACPGGCLKPSGHFELVITGTLSDVVVGGTGAFEEVTGTLYGDVLAAGRTSVVRLSGSLTLPD